LLAATDATHPPIEALFTIDEETGMTGAKGLQPGWLKGKLMLNLDTEEDDEIDIGCAGGIDITVNATYTPEKAADNYLSYIVTVTGLNGGHSGLEIHKGLGNANKIMNRILYHVQSLGLRINSVDGGSLRNAIPRESKAVISIPDTNSQAFENSINQISQIIKSELACTDAGLIITALKTNPADNWMPQQLQLSFLKCIYAAQNGVYAMSHVVPNLVETSNNLACVAAGNGQIKILCLTRSASETAKTDLAQSIQSAFELMPAEVTLSGSYPGWQPDANSKLLKHVTAIYTQLNKQQPKIVACHAGLECGIIKSKYPLMDMISIGPIIKGAHSPNERVHIKSVQKFWVFLNEILKTIPEV
ncbi:MAG TPA: beta-Ala-His dipeptidase, partial [Bacteroidia bacterium]|nr:beta-Ala-His dipeptidase [Bacteroidia bacterium]